MVFLLAVLQRISSMENITTGHWIFAGIFMIGFVAYLIWSYRKDAPIHKMYYGKGAKILLGMIVILFVLFIVKQLIIRT